MKRGDPSEWKCTHYWYEKLRRHGSIARPVQFIRNVGTESAIIMLDNGIQKIVRRENIEPYVIAVMPTAIP